VTEIREILRRLQLGEQARRIARDLEDVTVRRGELVTLHVRLRGGTATTLTVPRPLMAWERRRTSPTVLTTIDALLTDHTDAEVAALLNAQGLTTGASSSLAIASSGSAPPRACRVFATACARPTYSPPRNSPRPSASAMTR